jgi:chromate transporter
MDDRRGRLLELARLFTRMGLTSFGGPAAAIAIFRDEVVTRRQWLTDSEFLDLLGATNLIPGPNSTEMTMHIGHVRAGMPGLIVAGACFILPAALMVTALAALYVAYGDLPAVGWLLYGIKPVIIAIMIQAIVGLLRKAARTAFLAAIGVLAFALYFAGADELALMFGLALGVMLIQNGRRLLRERGAPAALGLLAMPLSLPALAQTVEAVPATLTTLFLTMLKIGAVLYGSGYVLLAFLRGDFVESLGWLTNQQLLDAVAVGQFTPGPLFTTAAFVGYIVLGVPGAVVATVGIFLPSFVFVAISSPLIPKMRRSLWFGALLDGLNVASLALMAAVTIELGRDALVDVYTVVLAIAAAVLLLRFKVNSTWLVIGGALAGVLSALVSGQL